jgi:hypothetical protein
MKQNLHRLDYRLSIGRVLQIAAVGVLLAASAFQMFGMQSADALQMTNRKVTISNSEISATGVEYDFAFTTATAGAIQGIRFQFCTTPLGTCTAPGGFTASGATVDGQSFTEVTAFADGGSADENDCTEATNAANEVCVERTDADPETAAAKTLDLGAITNANSQSTIYIRITTYSDNDFQTADFVDEGTVAAAMVRQLTVNGRVQERLEFCVSALDDAAALPANCAAMGTNTTIDLGVIDNTAVKVAPQNEVNNDGANDDYGVAQINTNASNGVVLAYFPDSAGTGTNELRSFRVTGATCDVSGTNLTDQCFVDASGAAEAFSAGTERFGLVVACVDNTQGITSNISTGVDAYDGDDDSIAFGADCENEGETEFAWNDASTAATLASSSSVVNDEIVKLRFAATASPTTPTGSYTVTTTYIATTTF